MLTGLVASAAFDLFRRHVNIWTFLLFAQVSLMAGSLAFYNAPFPLFIAWLVAESVLFRVATACKAFIGLGIAGQLSTLDTARP
jgi:hypothetical protein